MDLSKATTQLGGALRDFFEWQASYTQSLMFPAPAGSASLVELLAQNEALKEDKIQLQEANQLKQLRSELEKKSKEIEESKAEAELVLKYTETLKEENKQLQEASQAKLKKITQLFAQIETLTKKNVKLETQIEAQPLKATPPLLPKPKFVTVQQPSHLLKQLHTKLEELEKSKAEAERVFAEQTAETKEVNTELIQKNLTAKEVHMENANLKEELKALGTRLINMKKELDMTNLESENAGLVQENVNLRTTWASPPKQDIATQPTAPQKLPPLKDQPPPLTPPLPEAYHRPTLDYAALFPGSGDTPKQQIADFTRAFEYAALPETKMNVKILIPIFAEFFRYGPNSNTSTEKAKQRAELLTHYDDVSLQALTKLLRAADAAVAAAAQRQDTELSKDEENVRLLATLVANGETMDIEPLLDDFRATVKEN